MKIVLLGGAGIIGKVIARDLALTDEVSEVIVADLNEAGAQAAIAGAASGDLRFKATGIDVTDHTALVALLRGADCVINSVQYYFNLNVMRACLEAGSHYIDLGGLFHTTRKQLELNEDFQARGLTAILGLGSCPGIANVQPALVAGRFDTIRSIKIYNGATTDSRDSLAWPYSLATILDEMTERPVVFRNGEFIFGGGNMIELYRPPECPACAEIEAALQELVIAHEVIVVKPEQRSDLLPADTPLPAIKDDHKIISGPAITPYLKELEKFVADWRRFQGDTCYIDEDGSVC